MVSAKYCRSTTTADQVLQAIHRRWPEGCDILHVHNPLLAKNSRLLGILEHLQADGIRLLLQIHDFAEDGRPNAYYSSSKYTENCHYCVINSRDYGILLSAGLVEKGLHLLPNMVTPIEPKPGKPEDKKFILYPVRAIRRKNIGEAVLLTLLSEPGTRLAVTLAPDSPQDQTPYKSWLRFAEKNRLSVLFEASRRYRFEDLLKSAESLVTTSITEGFGFSFLEPWTAGRFLAGRKLADICRDFEENGLRLDHLYERLMIPLSAFDENLFFDRWLSCIKKNVDRFGVPMGTAMLRESYRDMTKNDWVDFGLLDEPLQQQAMERVIADTQLRRAIRDHNPLIRGWLYPPDRNERIADNRNAVSACYNKDVYRERLMAVYKTVMTVDVVQKIDKARLARAFLRPETFSLLKWGEYGLP